MLMLELILTKHPADWTDDEWKNVRDALKDGEITIEHLNQLEFPRFVHENVVTTPSNSFQNSIPCLMEEFFKMNKAGVVVVSCSCPKCVRYVCATGT